MKTRSVPQSLETLDRRIAQGEQAMAMQRQVLDTLRRLRKPTVRAERLLQDSAQIQRRLLEGRAALTPTSPRKARRAGSRG
jgi:hypothetical protein